MPKKQSPRHTGTSLPKSSLPASCTPPAEERKARRGRKQLAQLFPHLAPRLHKGVTQERLLRHAMMLARRPVIHPKKR